jgi:hypothetical protein
MLILVSWLAVYTLILLILNWVLRPVQDRIWFKVLFLPGTLIAIATQTIAGILTIGQAFRAFPIQDGKLAFEFRKDRLPCLAGTLFILLAHLFIFLLFFGGMLYLDSADLYRPDAVNLPDLYPGALFSGWVYWDFREYLWGLERLINTALRSPLIPLICLYLVAGTLASMRVASRESIFALILVLLLSGSAYVGEWLGVSFALLSRGWWARAFNFPYWWAIFSFFMTLSAATLLILLVPRVCNMGYRFFFRSPNRRLRSRGPERKKDQARATA